MCPAAEEDIFLIAGEDRCPADGEFMCPTGEDT
jgi:hypothetical protein